MHTKAKQHNLETLISQSLVVVTYRLTDNGRLATLRHSRIDDALTFTPPIVERYRTVFEIFLFSNPS